MLGLAVARGTGLAICAANTAPPRVLAILAAACEGLNALALFAVRVASSDSPESVQMGWLAEMLGVASDVLLLLWVAFLVRPTRRSTALLYVGVALSPAATGLSASLRVICDGDFSTAMETMVLFGYVSSSLVCGIAVRLATTTPRGAAFTPA